MVGVTRLINLLKMDLHRFLTNKLMYLLLLLFIAFHEFGIFMLKENEQTVEQGSMLVSSMNESQFIQIILAQTPSWTLMYITVFTVYFYMSEYNSGFYKNYISMHNARIYSVFSKIIIMGLFTLIMFLVMVIFDLIGRAIFFNNASIGDLGVFAKLLVSQILLHWAFSMVILFITMVIKSIIPSIVTGVILVLNVPGMIVSSVESLISNGDLSSYLLVNTIVSTKDFNKLNDLIHVVGVAAIFIIIFSFISTRYKMKEDLG